MRARPGGSHRRGGWSAGGCGQTGQSAATGQLLPITPLPPGCPHMAHPKGRVHTEGNTEELESICTSCQGHLAWQCLGMHHRGVPSIPSPRCCPSTAELLASAAELGTSHSSLAGPSRPHSPGTHNVRSLGMWLKLDTGMEVILLLFRVLREGRGGQVRAARP